MTSECRLRARKKAPNIVDPRRRNERQVPDPRPRRDGEDVLDDHSAVQRVLPGRRSGNGSTGQRLPTAAPLADWNKRLRLSRNRRRSRSRRCRSGRPARETVDPDQPMRFVSCAEETEVHRSRETIICQPDGWVGADAGDALSAFPGDQFLHRVTHRMRVGFAWRGQDGDTLRNEGGSIGCRERTLPEVDFRPRTKP